MGRRDVVYLIQQKYKQQRGFKLSGKSSNESLALLTGLDDSSDMATNQLAIEQYIKHHKNDVNQKRLYKILIELKNMCLPDVPHSDCHSRPEML